MTARACLVSVEPVESKGSIKDPIQFKINFELYEDLPEEIEFELAISWDGKRENDQILDSIEVGPVKAGNHQFVFDAQNLPDYSKIKDEDVTDVAAIFLDCSYRGNRFASVSFYVSHEYADEELQKNPPEKPQFDKLQRVIHTDDIRVTTYQIKWFDTDNIMPPVEEEPVEGEEAAEASETKDFPISV